MSGGRAGDCRQWYHLQRGVSRLGVNAIGAEAN